MDLLLRSLLTAGIVLLVIAGNLLLFRWLADGWATKVVVAPMQVVDSDGKRSPESAGMSVLLTARLDDLRRSVNEAQRQLRDPVRTTANEYADTRPLVSIDAAVLPDTDLELAVGGVELGGLLNWTRAQFVAPRQISLIASYGPDSVSIGGDVSALGLSTPTIWLENLKKNPADVVDAIAVSLYQGSLVADGVHEAGDLSWDELKTVIGVLDETAKLTARPRSFGTPQEHFRTQFERIEPIVEKAQRWPVLVHLAAQIARQADLEAKAIPLLERARDQYRARIPNPETNADAPAISSAEAKANAAAIAAIEALLQGLREAPQLRQTVASVLHARSRSTPMPAAVARKEIDTLTPDELARFRAAVATLMRNAGEPNYSSLAGIYSLPEPIYAPLQSPLYLPWIRAYVSTFEAALRQIDPSVSVPYWDFTKGGSASSASLPPAFTAHEALGAPNPLFAAPLPFANKRATTRGRPGGGQTPPGLVASHVSLALGSKDFVNFSRELESATGIVHVSIGGDMAVVNHAAYDPLFWSLYANVDRLWTIWQQQHGNGLPNDLADKKLEPFPLAAQDVVSVDRLNYRYQ